MIGNIGNTQFPLNHALLASLKRFLAISLEEVQVDLIDVIGDAASSLPLELLSLRENFLRLHHLFIYGQSNDR